MTLALNHPCPSHFWILNLSVSTVTSTRLCKNFKPVPTADEANSGAKVNNGASIRNEPGRVAQLTVRRGSFLLPADQRQKCLAWLCYHYRLDECRARDRAPRREQRHRELGSLPTRYRNV